MSAYADGRRVEYKVRNHLRANGYRTVRGASSKGFADIVAVKPGQTLFVNVKRTRMPGPAERAALQETAAWVGALPIIAIGRPREPITYLLLRGGAVAGFHLDFAETP